jgi:phosphoribosylanthranilate isomerase
MVRVKICGIRRREDADAAVEAGAGALGFNFVKGTPRYISPLEAARIIATVPEGLWCVGVFVDEAPDRVREIAALTGISVLQFHGSESSEYWDGFAPFKRIKALKVDRSFSPSVLAQFPSADAFLLDGSSPGMHGGTGQTFDWSMAERAKAFGRIIVAGGLNPGNVADAVRAVNPWAVDVSSGVESEPGRKDPRLIRAFVDAVHAADAELVSR